MDKHRRWPALLLAILFFQVAASCVQAEVLFERESPYNLVRVTQEGDYRYLSFDETRGSQSVINVNDLEELRFAYTRAMFLSLAFLDRLPEKVLLVGLGGGTMPRILHKHLPSAAIDVAELDPIVLEAAKNFFFFKTSPRMKVTVQDGRQFLHRSQEKYDLIMLDAYNNQAIPFHLTTVEFFRIVKDHVKPGGVVASNVWSPYSNRYHYSHIKTLQQVFKHLFAIQAVGSGNYVFLSTDQLLRLTRNELKTKALRLYEQLHLSIQGDEFADTFEDYTDRDVNAPILTDDFAPVDLLRSQRTNEP